MLVLFETPAGFALFKVLKEKKLKKVDDIFEQFESPEKAAELYATAAGAQPPLTFAEQREARRFPEVRRYHRGKILAMLLTAMFSIFNRPFPLPQPSWRANSAAT